MWRWDNVWDPAMGGPGKTAFTGTGVAAMALQVMCIRIACRPISYKFMDVPNYVQLCKAVQG